MAVMQNSIIFGGVDSADYGIYIGGEGTFNAPKRDVEMISIPGRNGAFALDKGRFENIEVTYSAFNYETDLATFAQNLSDFRNAICSQKGYQRLTDTFHTDEYRMAAYISGLEIKPIEYNTASTFDIVFDCKPQRWLTSGETAVTVANNGTLTNPTLFESSPLLAVTGYGDIGINDETITVQNELIGDIVIAEPLSATGVSYEGEWQRYVNLNTSNLNNGDTITISSLDSTVQYTVKSGYSNLSCSVSSTSNAFGECSATGTTKKVSLKNLSFVYGTSSTVTGSVTFTQKYWPGQGATDTVTRTITLKAAYSTVTNTITFTADTVETTACFVRQQNPRQINSSAVIGNSTKSALLSPIYIDLDIGEAYGYSSGSLISLNNITTMPAELPTLKSGTNTFTKSNTVTQLKVTSRWWKV